ncbi:phage major tail protein, TP901-1 family [Virgibacillus doumboii]|uniref:phage major tail protein, TP901-1 family n=1 Tax=Virgibacillus doumboii TaxID=2697503 RepID=UPI001FEA1D55|nr:phage major tail protein, TP901-1 family [Virgibacillus doumboii]
MTRSGKKSILMAQLEDAVIGSDAFVLGHLTEHTHSIENEILNEASKFGRIKEYGENDESFDTTMYVEEGDAGQSAIKKGIKQRKKIKLWEVNTELNANGMHDAIFAYCIAENYEKSSPGDGLEEITSTLSVIGTSQDGELAPLPPEVIEFAQYGFETPGETGADQPAAPTNLTSSNVMATTADLSWDAVTYDGGISEYRIYRDGTQVGTSATTTFSDSGLTASTEYSYQVSAVGNNGVESELSTALTVTTTA